jgi:beta-galactosidase
MVRMNAMFATVRAAVAIGSIASFLNAAQPPGTLSNVLYGAAYYHEYMPYERLDKDVALMKEAGLSVVRMGESTWSLWEPQDGVFEYAWMDRVVDAMAKAGIKVIMGTPTYSIPTWMYHEHPEITRAAAWRSAGVLWHAAEHGHR